MKVTKKTMLLAALKRVTINALTVDTVGNVKLQGDNLDGVSGFYEDDNLRFISPTITKADGTSAAVNVAQDPAQPITDNWEGRCDSLRFAVGEQVTLSVEVDPAKPDYRQGAVSKTVTVTD